jgi:hypothetical protein
LLSDSPAVCPRKRHVYRPPPSPPPNWRWTWRSASCCKICGSVQNPSPPPRKARPPVDHCAKYPTHLFMMVFRRKCSVGLILRDFGGHCAKSARHTPSFTRTIRERSIKTPPCPDLHAATVSPQLPLPVRIQAS